MKTQLHPGAKWLFRIRAYFAMLFLAIFFGWLVVFLVGALTSSGSSIIGAFAALTISFFVSIAIIILISEIYTQMAYNRWFYEFTDNNLKTEHGIIWKRYSNIPYERIQNVEITRGIIARMLGFSSVMIQTAGFSYAPNNQSAWAEGYLPAIEMEHAEKIREFLMKKISKRYKNQGL